MTRTMRNYNINFSWPNFSGVVTGAAARECRSGGAKWTPQIFKKIDFWHGLNDILSTDYFRKNPDKKQKRSSHYFTQLSYMEPPFSYNLTYWNRWWSFLACQDFSKVEGAIITFYPRSPDALATPLPNFGSLGPQIF